MKYALIGCGRISFNHIQAALDNNLDIIAICDIDPKMMKEKKEKFNLGDKVKLYEDYQEMLKNEKLDLVAITTESGKHAAIAIDCLNAGINLIIEKPIALSMNDARTIVKLAREKKLVVSPSHQNRFNKSIAKVREAVEENKFGRKLYGTAHIRWNRGESYYKQAPWRGTWEQDGGALMNQCIHNIDLLIWMMDSEVDTVFAFTDNLMHDYIEAEDLGIALLKFKDGSHGIIEGTTNVYPKNLEETLYIFGEQGTVKVGGTSVNVIEEWLFKDEDAEKVKSDHCEHPKNVYGFGHNPLYKNVILAIKEGKDPYVIVEDGMRAVEVVLAIYQSAKTGLPVKLPLNGVASTDFKGRF